EGRSPVERHRTFLLHLPACPPGASSKASPSSTGRYSWVSRSAASRRSSRFANGPTRPVATSHSPPSWRRSSVGWPCSRRAASRQCLAPAAADGGALAALVLGHWYLVTPRLSERPLVLLARLLLGVIALQALLGATWLLSGANAALPPLAPLGGPAALFVWF